MEQKAIIDTIRGLTGPIQGHGVTALAIFGSRARGDHGADSDLDVMIDFAPGSGFSLLDLCAVERLIEERTGIAVQATTRSSMSPRFRQAVERDAIEVL